MSIGPSIILSKLFGEVWRPLRRKAWNAVGKKTHGQRVEEEFERVKEELQEAKAEKERLEKKDEKINEKERKLTEIQTEVREKENRISRFERIMRSLEREGVKRRELLKKYERPLPVILLAYTNQKSPLGTSNSFVRDELSERLDLQWYGGHDAVIPPRAVKEAGIEGIDDFEVVMEEIFEDEENDRYAVIKYATIVDLAGEVYWYNNLPYDTSSETVAEALDMEDILEDAEFLDLISEKEKDALERIIREGDIGFFSSRWVEESDLDRIHDNQAKIEQHLNEELPELNLTNLASEEAPEALFDVLSNFLHLSDSEVRQVAKDINEEAKIWREELDL